MTGSTWTVHGGNTYPDCVCVLLFNKKKKNPIHTRVWPRTIKDLPVYCVAFHSVSKNKKIEKKTSLLLPSGPSRIRSKGFWRTRGRMAQNCIDYDKLSCTFSICTHFDQPVMRTSRFVLMKIGFFSNLT